ncbi:alpha/beta hydrolase [Natronosalvus halobius]|uniref:alpha/beta hydrolase n=1 Tax=Natronosalvus halobius TaxID=2953746 RepID=UPI0020A16B59|nr:alpha/beta fold hydrolase [Natronosalvus halobius]USZ73163.1 alpha/beta fold hydrolase [Natronosalvus halobius]
MVPSRNAEDTVHTFATRFGDGTLTRATDLLTVDGRAAVVESFPDEFQEPVDAVDALELYWRGLYAQYGDFEGVGEVEVDGTGANVTLEFEDGTERASIDIDDATGITEFSFSPTYEAPEYVDRNAFSERNVTVEAGSVNLEGVLAVPDSSGPVPAALLVHGAGIHDLDGTDGASKILKDLAWGLASQGIATLRYEKRLAEHDVEDEHYTLDTVVVDDAIAAIDELAATDEVAEDAVFVAGHSQGGMCAPRIAARHGGVAGVVALDARADSTLDPDDLAILRYEFEPDGDLSEGQEAELERERETVRRLAERDYDDDETVWGRPGTWHRSVGAYDPAGTASSLEVPCFVLKAGRADEEVQPELAV